MDYATWISGLPAPSSEECDRFAEYVCRVHSWYKHLPPLEGGEFVFFIAPDVKPVGRYHEALGFLDYMARQERSGWKWLRDAGEAPDLPDDLVAAVRVVLYPYASNQRGASGCLFHGIHQDVLEALGSGFSHPEGSLVLEWHRAQSEVDRAWPQLSDAERQLVLTGATLKDLPPGVSRYLRLSEEAESAYLNLQRREQQKVRGCLDALCSWLSVNRKSLP